MRLRLLLLSLISLLICCPLQAAPGEEIQTFIDEAIKAGGGEVVIPPGTHVLPRGLRLKGAAKIRLVGLNAETCILKLPPMAFAETKSVAASGDDRIAVTRQRGIATGMTLHIETEGEVDAFTKKPTPYALAKVKAVEDGVLILTEALKFPVPAGTFIRDANAPNLMEISGNSEGLVVEKLTLDGGREPGDPPIRGHAQLCGIFATGPYTYEKGPTGPRVKGVQVSRCIIQNCHGRGIAFYSVEESLVENCTIMDTTDEAVDLDHFTLKTAVKNNHIARSGVGVELNDATGCLISGNEIRDCGIGVNLWRWCRLPGLNEGNQIVRNTIVNTTGNGVQIGLGTSGNTISDNEISRSGRNGISLQGEKQTASGNVITGSKLQDINPPRSSP